VVARPCAVGNQEPGTEAEVETFCTRNFGVTFPMMSKVEVNGDSTHPVYQFLKHERKQMFMERIKWCVPVDN
jgi:glutathione peroxidase-family protein